ncbi:unnamed protein product [Rotaria magnacalcarata]|uniref:Uncharacterized protein n=1 Tax=Rotaria magnacalcarata TaxID=392030 RepID=A0A816CFP6_9BILA|nr:unnamed protein product [Rotaria magnacalcarata]CAF4157035.1 unnamed protein product [Rotaria magnacalcarata]
MGQRLSSVDKQIFDFTNSDRSTHSSLASLSVSDPDDASLLLSKTLALDAINDDHQISDLEQQWMKQIQNNLSLLTNISELEKINKLFSTSIMMTIATDYRQMIQEIKELLEQEKRLKISLTTNMERHTKGMGIHDNSRQQQHQTTESDNQHSSFTYKISSLLKSAERNVSTAIHHVYEKLPIRRSSWSDNDHFVFEPNKYQIDESSQTNYLINKRQIEKILLKFSKATTSFNDILFVLNRLIFDTNNVYDVRDVFIRLNNNFTAVRDEWQCDTNSTADEFNQTTSNYLAYRFPIVLTKTISFG